MTDLEKNRKKIQSIYAIYMIDATGVVSSSFFKYTSKREAAKDSRLARIQNPDAQYIAVIRLSDIVRED